MTQELSGDELREMIRTLSRAVGLPLSEDRIDVVLPQYRVFLGDVQRMADVEIPVEVEPLHVFDLSKRWRS